MGFVRGLVAGLALLLTAQAASAQPVVLTFEGLQNLERVGDYYNGGRGGSLGVSFTGAAQGLVTTAVTDLQLFKNQPSGLTVMALGASASALPVARLQHSGFSTLSFYYASSFFAEVEFLAGGVPLVPIGATSSRIGLSPNNIKGIPAFDECSDSPPEATYCNWTQVSFSFAVAATSVSFFTTRDNEILFDDLTITPVARVDDPPTISDVVNQSTPEDTATGALAFTVGDVKTAAASLTVTGASSNPTLVPSGNVVIGGGGASRTVTITPAANRNGTATITLTVSDGTATATDTFVLTVTAVNDPPTISDVGNQSTAEGTATGALAFTVGDVETAAASLTVTGASSNPTLVPSANVVIGGSGASRTVTIAPAANQNGTATITLTVSDGTATATDTFVLTVTAGNGAANLRVSNLKGASVAGAGLPYSVTDTTSNVGTAAAPPSATWFYLSTTATLGGGEAPLAPTSGRAVPGLAVGQAHAGTTLVTIPAGTTPGKRYLISSADGGAAIIESDETDNRRAKVIYVGPDLTVVTLVAPVTARAGETIAVSETTRNSGGAPTTSVTTTRLYLSTNQRVDTADVPLGSQHRVALLAAGASSVGDTRITIPVGTGPGEYYLLARADDGNNQVESREANNVRVRRITIY